MATLDAYKTIPVGSILIRPESEDGAFLIQLRRTPPGLLGMITAPRTGAFIRGVAKTHDLSLQHAAVIAYHVLQVAFGTVQASQLTPLLGRELNVDAATSLKIAQEIERELFTPYAQELGQQHMTTKSTPPVPPAAGGARNVLDLKNQPRPPQPLPSRQ